jgi:hypothetical protein
MISKPPYRMPLEAEFREAKRLAIQQRYLRKPSKGGRVAALSALHTILADDALLYASDDLQDKRDAVAHSLLAVVNYLELQGFDKCTLSPLMRPVAALAERENNSLDLMFAQRARNGRPKATLEEHERTGILAVMAETWLLIHVEDERLQKVKLAEAARRMKGRWFGSVTCAQLETAREVVSQEAKDHPAVGAARMFAIQMKNCQEKFGAKEAFAIMVRTLNDLQLPFGAGEGGISKTPPVSPT